ncbi:ComEC/Rec2 family competence protein [Actinomycetospora chibensis]|uniref:ComEC/Rec2 family competence protein n=1 Tax=Actinomycetospora chibensis TaxID=663606 RepID=A0ABV9RFZ2_9PSEU|nr:ComEC/Rec2 family competence protein [Actinomycetospora chibensis]MDD7922944.1 ComEC/Rec2 family competence protein [Actinomycetospora chibensis]
MSTGRPPPAPGEPELPPPPDLRLVPAALASWGVAIAALTAGWGAAALLVLAGATASVIAARRPAGTGSRSGVRAVAIATGGCAAAVGLVAGLGAFAVASHPLRPATGNGVSARLDVVVTADPRPVRSTVPGPGRVVVRGELLGGQVGAGVPWRAGGGVVLLAPAEDWAGLLPGQVVAARGRLGPPDRADLTVAVLQVRGPPGEVGPVPLVQRVAGDLRGGLRDAARAVLAEDPAGLLPGLVVGDTSGVSPGLADDFRTAGLTHLTAVSGTNVAIICGAVLLLARLARAGPRTVAVLAALALAGFVVLARPSPSVLRAAVMGGVTVLALAVGRRRSVVPALCAAVIVLLLVDPGLATDPGFALSVLATGALVLLAPGMVARWRARGVPPGIAEALAVPVAAHVVTAPVIAGLSCEVSLVAVVANLLAAPVIAPVTVLGVLAAAVAPWWAGGAEALVWLAGPGVSWLVWVARRCAAVQGATVTWPGGVPGALALAGVVVLVGAALRWRRLRVVVAAVLVGALLVLVPTRVVPPGWPPARWSLVACDVGQGDALVLATGEPGRAVLVDVGPDAGAIDGCLARLGVRSLALVVLTHLHADHVGGLAGALAGRAVGGVALGPAREPADTLAQVVRRTATARAPLVGLGRGTVLRWPGLVLEVLGPVRTVAHVDGEDGSAVNDTSVVLRAHTPVGRVLLPGDAERSAQSSLLGTAGDLHAEILKVPHHGSRSSLPTFLTAARASLALVSVGRGNTYGHPNPGVMGLLAGSGALVRRTDESGDLAVVVGADPRAGAAVVARGDPRPDPRRR